MYQFNKTKFFYEADDGANKGGGTVPPTAESAKTVQAATGTQGENKPTKTFTQEELDKIVGDRVARATEKKAKEIEEAQKLANMSESERQAAELKKARDELNQYKNEKLTTQFKLELSNKTLPPDFADFIPVSDAEKAKAAVDFLAKYKADVTSVLQKEIDDLKQQLNNANLRGITPKAVSGTANQTGNISPMGKLFAQLKQ